LIEKYRAERLKIGVSKSTVNRELTIMKKMYNLAIDWNLANENPVAKVKLFSEKGTEKARILAHAEEAALIAESPDYLRPILIVAVNTGMRRGEILNLKWSQVDLGSGLIRVEQTKSGHMRFIPINDQARGALREAQGQNTASVYVFPNPRTGMPFTEARKSFKAACQRAGISDLRFHDLRHYAEFRTMPSWITRIIKLLESKRIVVLMGELYSA
jgi:integrase